MKRMLNKPIKKQSLQKHNYDEDTYLRAMKKFQKESRGLLKGSPEYDSIRNKIYGELRQQKAQSEEMLKKSKEAFKQYQSEMVVANFSSFYSMLIVVPEQTESYETVHVLRYYDFPVNVEEDNIVKPLVKKEMGFRVEDEVISILLKP